MTRIVPRKNVDGNGHDARQLRVSDYPFNLSLLLRSPIRNSRKLLSEEAEAAGGFHLP